MEELKIATQSKSGRQSGARAGRWAAMRDTLHRTYVLYSRILRKTFVSVLDHDCLNLAQSTAYSAIVALFPTLIVAAAVINLLPDTTPLRFQLAILFDRILPPGVNPMLDAYFSKSPSNTYSVRALVGAGVVSFLGASNVVVTLMEGLRRAKHLPPNCWSFWQRRRRAFELVPLSMVPLTVASLLVVFGHTVTGWIAANIGAEVRPWVYALAVAIRWVVALGASIGLIALVYHLGTPERRLGVARKMNAVYVEEDGRQHNILLPGAWMPVLPGAIMATAMWFLTTLTFGWYVTRFANYSQIYGSLGAGIALLFWLYIISLSVLSGAEFNAHFHAHIQMELHANKAVATGEAEPNAGRDVTQA